MYYTKSWITQIHGLHKTMIFCVIDELVFAEDRVLHKFIYYTNSYITQIYELYRYMNHTDI